MKNGIRGLIKGDFRFFSLLGFFLAISLSASAENIPIQNHSFELPALSDGDYTDHFRYADPIPGWTITGSTDIAGVWNPRVGQGGGEPPEPSQAFVDGIPDGSQVAYSNGGDISQTLGETLQAGHKYTLTVYVGGRAPIYSDRPYAVILAGNAELARQTGINISDSWSKITATYTAPLDDPNAGQPLTIKLVNTEQVAQLNFDKVTLDASPLLTCQGFLPPFDRALTLQRKSKRTIPVKIVLRDQGGSMISGSDIATPPVVNVTFSSQPACEDHGNTKTEKPGLQSPPDSGNDFRYDPLDQIWIINLGTGQFSAPGTYTVTVAPGDDSYVIEGCNGQTFTRCR